MLPSEHRYDGRFKEFRRLKARCKSGGKLPCKEDVLQCLADGWSILDIADEWGFSVETINMVKRKAMIRLKAKSLPHAIAVGFRSGLLK